jgi:hypothetical protein
VASDDAVKKSVDDYRRHLRNQRTHRAKELVEHRRKNDLLKRLNIAGELDAIALERLQQSQQREREKRQQELEAEVQQRTLEVQSGWTKKERRNRLYRSTVPQGEGDRRPVDRRWTPPSVAVLANRHKVVSDEDANRLAVDH